MPRLRFSYLFSAVSNTPYVSSSHFLELAVLKAEWQTLREEAIALYEAGHLRAAEKYNDIGFNSFFRKGWKRLYLKWYDNPHPFAAKLCPPDG